LQERVLLIDDDDRLCEMLTRYLSGQGFAVERRGDGASGLALALRRAFDVLVLDVMLPDFDGFEVCRRLRKSSNVPVLMLTARGEEMDRIVGLEIGADDYLPKPFNPRELVARLRAILRRRSAVATQDENAILRFGRLEIDRGAREVRVGGKARELTSYQFDLLYALVERADRVQSREQLMESVSGHELEAFDRSIDVHISRIRAAIEDDPRRPRHIKTVRSVGYVFVSSGHK
jgi:DNA-binding response OmpR family regulator